MGTYNKTIPNYTSQWITTSILQTHLRSIKMEDSETCYTSNHLHPQVKLT